MLSFLETPGDIKRFLEIMRVFLKYGWESAVEVRKMKEKFPFLSRLEGSRVGGEDLPAPIKLRKILEELGPTFIKFGQMLSTRPDLVKPEFLEELKKLQDEAPPFDFLEADEIIKKQFGKPVKSIYKKFEKKPVAAASLGQVHLAELKNRRLVAVKVQRPDIEHTIAEDMRIISFIAGLLEKNITETKFYNPTNIAKEFAETLKKELDYNMEAKNAEKFARNFKNTENVRIPKIFWDYTGRKVITMERVHGKKISSYYTNKNNELKKRIAVDYIDCFFKQMLVHGFFQADPHPANIFISMHKGKPIISLVDFGMVGRMDYETRDNFATAMVLIVERNIKGLTRHFQAMKLIDKHLENERQFMIDLSEIIDYFYDTEFERIDFAGFSNALIGLMIKHHVKVPKHYILFLRSLSIAQDTVQQLYPDINFIENAKPYIISVMEEKTKPAYLLKSFRENYFEMNRFVRDLPESVMKIFRKMEEEDFKISVEAHTLDEFGKSLHKSTNTLSISIIVAALIVASTIMLNIRLQTAIGNTVDIGAMGFMGALIIGLLVIMKALNA